MGNGKWEMVADGWAGAHDIVEDGEESGMGAGVVAGRKKSKGFSKEQTERELKRGGKLPISGLGLICHYIPI